MRSIESKRKRKEKECPTLGHSLSRPVMMYQNSENINLNLAIDEVKLHLYLHAKVLQKQYSLLVVTASTVSQ